MEAEVAEVACLGYLPDDLGTVSNRAERQQVTHLRAHAGVRSRIIAARSVGVHNAFQ